MLDRHLIHHATITRYRIEQTNYGKDRRGDVLSQQTQVACRLVTKQQTVIQSDIAERAVVTMYLLLLGANADIRHGDEVIVNDQSFVVTSILARNSTHQHHMSCNLERFNG